MGAHSIFIMHVSDRCHGHEALRYAKCVFMLLPGALLMARISGAIVSTENIIKYNRSIDFDVFEMIVFNLV